MARGIQQEGQLRRQASWLGESWRWILRTRGIGAKDAKPTALDVGCGPGIVMENLSDMLDVTGVDLDPGMVTSCKSKGLRAVEGDARKLPFGDGAFDVAYCSYLLLWLEEPVDALREMRRVSRRWVVCLAEPDYGARIDYPPELEDIGKYFRTRLESEGADPFVGRKLSSLFAAAGMRAEVGVHPGAWGAGRSIEELDDEWEYIEGLAPPSLKKRWKMLAEKGEAFQHNPVFWAVGERE